MRRLLIVAASAVALLAIGFGAEVALRDEAGAPEPRAEPGYIYQIGPVTITCGKPPYKPCSTVRMGSVQTVLLQE